MNDQVTPLGIPDDARVVVLTGAGISAESGIQTFRNAGGRGLWENHDVHQVATPEGFDADPDLVWRFYSARRLQAARCEPNPGHVALAALERRLAPRGHFLLATQNVDGLHRRAGSQRVSEVHGSLWRTRCETPGCPRAVPFEDQESHDHGTPRCPDCGGRWRPDIVWFGESLDEDVVDEVHQALASCDVFLAVGTSGAVYPAAGYVMFARAHGARTVLVNLDPPDNLGAFREFHPGKSGELLPSLLGVEGLKSKV